MFCRPARRLQLFLLPFSASTSHFRLSIRSCDFESCVLCNVSPCSPSAAACCWRNWAGFWGRAFHIWRLTALDAQRVRIGIMSGSFIFRPALEEYWSQQPTADDASPAASQPTSSAEAPASVPAPATALTRPIWLVVRSVGRAFDFNHWRRLE